MIYSLRVIAITTFLFSPAASAQGEYVKERNPWPVEIDGDTLDLPFWGGINNPKPSFVDFNNDNLIDLMIGEVTGKLAYIKNTGTPSSPQWTPAQDQLGGVDIGLWYTFCDIDSDGDVDLFCDSKSSLMLFYRNDSDGDSVAFTLVDTAFGDFVVAFNSTPAFADLDADGDPDYFFGALSGALEFSRNDGDSANPSFIFVDSFYDSIWALPGGGTRSPVEPQHGYSNIKFADVDSDDDSDLFFGDIFNPNLYFFPNLGNPANSDLTYQTDTYLPTSTINFNHATLADLDGDSDLDMLLGVANGSNIDNLVLYRNSGTPSAPVFVEEVLNYIENIDVNSYAVATFGDLDNDGDYDLLIGSNFGQLWYFENVGSWFSPSFSRVSDSYKGIDVGFHSAPILVDWDGDNDLDLLIGNLTGKIQYWRNEGSISNFDPVLVTNQLAGIKVDQIAIPCPADLNNDGLIDLVVGEWDFNNFANLLLYENVGTLTEPSLTLRTSKLLVQVFREFALPRVYDWDGDGRDDIILGGKLSGLTFFRNTADSGQFPDSTTLLAQPDTIPGWDDGYTLAVTMVDIDGDGDDDIFVGEEDGGLNFYRRSGSCCNDPRGDINGSGGTANVADLTYLVDFLFRGGPEPPCLLEANVNGDAGENVNVADLTYLVDFLFRGGSPPPSCP